MRFSEIAHAVPDLSDRLLSERMKELERSRDRRAPRHGTSPVRVEYELTDRGRELDAGARRAQGLGRPLVGLSRWTAGSTASASRGGLVSRAVPPEETRRRPQTTSRRSSRSAGSASSGSGSPTSSGQLKSFAINAEELDDAFEGGMGFDGSSITGFNAIEESDMIAMPDPTTFARAPVAAGRRTAAASRACSPTC